jgi:hypothetical protein
VYSIYIFHWTVKIPLEVLNWNLERRQRYKENIKLGKQKMYRARGMLVGCTGAGKTTLRKLQRSSVTDQEEPTETTLGLELHTNLFEIVENTLKGYLTFETSN